MSKNSHIQRLPVEVDPFRLVEQMRQLEGRIPQVDFPRLQDLLLKESGDHSDVELVDVRLQFTRTKTGLPVILGELETELKMVCNRCLKGTRQTIKTDIEVVLVSSDAEADKLQQGFDTWLVEDKRIYLRDFIEDELLLALPIAVSHEACEPDRELVEALPEDEEQEDAQQDSNPFASLKDLKLN